MRIFSVRNPQFIFIYVSLSFSRFYCIASFFSRHMLVLWVFIMHVIETQKDLKVCKRFAKWGNKIHVLQKHSIILKHKCAADDALRKYQKSAILTYRHPFALMWQQGKLILIKFDKKGFFRNSAKGAKTAICKKRRNQINKIFMTFFACQAQLQTKNYLHNGSLRNGIFCTKLHFNADFIFIHFGKLSPKSDANCEKVIEV